MLLDKRMLSMAKAVENNNNRQGNQQMACNFQVQQNENQRNLAGQQDIFQRL